MTFDEAVAGGEVLLQDLILQEAQETLQLDFKGSAADKQGALFTSDGKLTKDGRRAIAKQLSAFSNSAGGVLLIGVDCRTVDNVDSAQKLDPISNWKAALSSVNSAVGDLLQPKNDGIRVAAFASAQDGSTGYLVIDVPRSERRPHMCNMTKQYFKRSGSGSYAMEHVDIEDAFSRASLPDLVMKTRFRRGSNSGPHAEYLLEFWLENVGEATAFFPSIHLNPQATFSIKWPSHVLGVHREATPDGQMSYGNSEFVIHPGQTRLIEHFLFKMAFDSSYQIPQMVGGEHIAKAALIVRYSLFAKDMPRKGRQIAFGTAEFLEVPWNA